MPDCQSTWKKCLEYIEQKVTMSSYKTWFAPLKAVSLENDRLTLEIPSMYFRETLEGQYINTLAGALRSVIGPGAQLQYALPVVKEPRESVLEPAKVGREGVTLSGGYNKSAGNNVMNPFVGVGIRTMNIDPQLNEDYTFENYVEGECNKLARTVAYAVSEKPGVTAFNPLFIYGASGVGKTHLIQAIGMEVKRRDPSRNVIYLSANRFMRQYMDATKNNQTNGFMNFYQMIDVLIIDDIQELAGKTGTENVFFQIFNHLQQNKRQIVIAADKRPIDITGMEERLLSRFKAGVVSEVLTPDYETRVKIIKRKIEKDGIEMPNDVVEYLASNVTANVRELEGSLVSLLAHATLAHRDITMDVARSVVGCLVKSERRDVTVDSIMETVCGHFGIEVSALQLDTRKHEIVNARQIAMFLCKEMTQASLSTIGMKLGKRNHSTVLYACKTVSNLLETDKDFERTVNMIREKIRG